MGEKGKRGGEERGGGKAEERERGVMWNPKNSQNTPCFKQNCTQNLELQLACILHISDMYHSIGLPQKCTTACLKKRVEFGEL